MTFIVPFRLAVQTTSLPGEASIREFKRTLMPLMQRLWRRETLRRRELARQGGDPEDAAASDFRGRAVSLTVKPDELSMVGGAPVLERSAAGRLEDISSSSGPGRAATLETRHNDTEKVVQITVSLDDIQRYCPGDPDLAILNKLSESVRQEQLSNLRRLQEAGQPLLPEDLQGTGELHYVARRRLRKSDIEKALWGAKIEHWCMEDELQSLLTDGYDDDAHKHDADHH